MTRPWTPLLAPPRRARPVRAGVVLVAAIGLLAGCIGGQRATPGPTAGSGGPTQRLVYRVADTSGPNPTITTVVQEVEAPFRARTLTFQGEGTATPLGGFASAEGALYTIKADGTVAQTAVVIPAESGQVSGLSTALPVAEREQVVSRTGTDTVLGRACTQWQSKEPLDDNTFAPAGAGNHTTSCVDAAGHILKEAWYLSGVLARTRTAIEVSTAPALDDLRLFGGQTPAPPPAGIPSEEVKALTGPADHDFGVHVLAPPPGFTFDRAVALRDNVGGDTAPVPVRVGQVSTYRRGADLVVIKRVVNLIGRPVLPARGAPVELGRLGPGKLEPTYSGLVVSFVTTSGVLVEVTGSIGAADLLSWVRSLQLRPVRI